MYTVIDTINCRGKHNSLQLKLGEGLLVILDPNQIRGRPNIPNNSVVILRPDNKTIERDVTEIDVNPDLVVGLFFSNMFPETIPRLSVISWQKIGECIAR